MESTFDLSLSNFSLLAFELAKSNNGVAILIINLPIAKQYSKIFISLFMKTSPGSYPEISILHFY